MRIKPKSVSFWPSKDQPGVTEYELVHADGSRMTGSIADQHIKSFTQVHDCEHSGFFTSKDEFDKRRH